jgi:hypothetical protein
MTDKKTLPAIKWRADYEPGNPCTRLVQFDHDHGCPCRNSTPLNALAF